MRAVARTVTGVSVGLAVATMVLSAEAAAQQLWSVEEVAARPARPIVMDGVAMTAAAAGTVAGEAAAVRVVYDYLRLGMGYLELPLPDGSVVEAENAVFEDRGGGNLMWTGEVPGAGYESVVFTVQDGYLVGWFGAPGGPKYAVYAGPDGRGSLAEEVGPVGDWCGLEAAGEVLTGLDRTPASIDRPWSSAAPASGGGRLDVLLLYPGGTERYWRPIGGAAVGVQQLADYLNMAFRNGEIPATANLIPVRWDPKVTRSPSVQAWHLADLSISGSSWHWEFELSAEVARLRARYKPDLIHFVPHVGANAGGQAGLRFDLNARVFTGWSIPSGRVVAHEIGHNLGGHHEPVTFNDFAGIQADAFRPYMFGHTDLTSCSEREGYGEYLWCPATIMSYGWDVRDDPERLASFEPFYSSVRHRPNGWTIGVAGEREVERVFHETVPVAVVSSEAPWRGEPYPREVGVRWTGRDTVRVDWSDGWQAPGGGSVLLTEADGASDFYSWHWSSDDPTVLHELSDDNVTPIVEAGGLQVGVAVSGLRPGGRYGISVLGAWQWDSGTDNWRESLYSDVYDHGPPRRASGSPVAPSDLDASVAGANSVLLSWRGNSNNEAVYEIWYRKWSGGNVWARGGTAGTDPDTVWRRYGESVPAGTRSAEVGGLAAEEQKRVTNGYWDEEEGVWVEGTSVMIGRYSFVVVAYNDAGFAASEALHLEFMPGPHPAPTPSGQSTDCDLWGRPSGVDLGGYHVNVCVETPDGARRRAWDFGLEAEQSGLLYFFGRDNAEVLVKVLDGCAVNGHRWAFVAPVTDLPFRLGIRESGPYVENRRQYWHYDSERRPQAEIPYGRDGNPRGRSARTVSDVTAFPCTTAEIAAAKADLAAPAHGPLMSGTTTDCEPAGRALTLLDGYRVSMCYETENGETGAARDWGLESNRMGLLYFSDRDRVEALIKVRDDCAVSGNVSVFAAPATTAAFNLRVESPNGYVWSHSNRLGETAEAVSDVSAFPCTGSPPEAVLCMGVTCLLQGERFRVKAWYSKGGSRSRKAGAVAAALGASAGLFGGDSADPELLVRVVNRCGTSGWWEVHGGVASDADFRFAIRDTKTNALKWFRPRGRSVVDTEAFACTESDSVATVGGAPADPGASCTGATCLLRDRLFRVKSWYRLDGGSSGPAAAVSVDLGGSAGLYAFESGNPELLVRVADTCSTTGYWTVYAGAASDAAFSVAIRHTGTNELKWFRSSGGKAIADTTAFACR